MGKAYTFKAHSRLKKLTEKLQRNELSEYAYLTGNSENSSKKSPTLLSDPYRAGSKNHPLIGSLTGYRALSFGHKKQWRLIFKVKENEVEVYGIYLGKHDQGGKDVYAKVTKIVAKDPD